jgi:hypothetical protein
MSVGLRKAKEKAKRCLPENYFESDLESKAYIYCVRNNIIISPIGIKDTVGSWRIGISLPGKHSVVHKSPEVCDKFTVMEIMYRYCIYYYNKRNNEYKD